MKRVIIVLLLACAIVFAQKKPTAQQGKNASPQSDAFYVPYPTSLLTPYKKEERLIYWDFVKNRKTKRPPVVVSSVYTQKRFEEDDDITGVVRNVELQINDEATSAFLLSGRNPAVYSGYMEKSIGARDAQLEKLREKYKEKINEEKMYHTPLYKGLSEVASNLSTVSKESKSVKEEFETTEQYNQRLKDEEQKFRDNSETRFLEAINSVVDVIQKNIGIFHIVFEKYDADKGIYTVVSDSTMENKHIGQIKVSPEEAKFLRENSKKLKFNIDLANVYSVNYGLYITKMEILCDNKTYSVEFPEIKNMKEIVFRGSELWKENPAVKNTSKSFSEIAIKAKEQEAAEKKARQGSVNIGGEVYPTVKINNAIWMAKNLNLNKGDSKCYDNKPENCDKYGRLYDWKTAKEACSQGWHLPSVKEWDALIDYAGGEEEANEKLKATSGWDSDNNGTDALGFAALPGGGYHNPRDGFRDIGKKGYWWSSSAGNPYIHSYGINSGWDNYFQGSAMLSVRCVQD
jgi:uncharacterized protein (TIGR02145 family)